MFYEGLLILFIMTLAFGEIFKAYWDREIAAEERKVKEGRWILHMEKQDEILEKVNTNVLQIEQSVEHLSLMVGDLGMAIKSGFDQKNKEKVIEGQPIGVDFEDSKDQITEIVEEVDLTQDEINPVQDQI